MGVLTGHILSLAGEVDRGFDQYNRPQRSVSLGDRLIEGERRRHA